MNADRPPLADTGGLTDADSQSIAWLRAHVCFLVALLSFGGAGLLIASEITDRLERVEGDLEPTALNLAIATPLALLVVSLAALLGDSLLARAERRSGRRPGARLLGPLLTVAGGADHCGCPFTKPGPRDVRTGAAADFRSQGDETGAEAPRTRVGRRTGG